MLNPKHDALTEDAISYTDATAGAELLFPACLHCGVSLTRREQREYEAGGADKGEWPTYCEACCIDVFDVRE
jgi:hypothetical protein